MVKEQSVMNRPLTSSLATPMRKRNKGTVLGAVAPRGDRDVTEGKENEHFTKNTYRFFQEGDRVIHSWNSSSGISPSGISG